MIFFFNFGSGSGSMYAAPLLFLLPAIFGNSPLSVTAQIILNLLNPFGFTAYSWGSTLRPTQQASQQPSVLYSLVMSVCYGLIGYTFWRAFRLAQGRSQFSRGRNNTAASGGTGQPTVRPNFDQVASTLQKLPMEMYASQADLQHMSVHELKVKLGELGLPCNGCLEKQELVAKILEAGGSSSITCSICCDEYTSGDVLRVLPCKHRFHLECVDRWFLSATDYTRPPACPLCNEALVQASS